MVVLLKQRLLEQVSSSKHTNGKAALEIPADPDACTVSLVLRRNFQLSLEHLIAETCIFIKTYPIRITYSDQ